MTTQRGLFIVFEGCDKSGKTTQSKRLEQNLPNSFRQPFPDRSTPVGEILNTYLQSKVELDGHASHLLFSANRWEVAEKIKEKLFRGINVIADRYAYSGVACSAVVNDNRQEFLNWAKNADRGLPKPDIVIYLDTTLSTIKKRGDFGDERYETDLFQSRVAKVFLEDLFDDTYWVVVDGSMHCDYVTKRINEVVAEHGIKGKLAKLW